jgi:hypothetical protein
MNQKYYLLDHLHTHYNKFLELLNAIEKIIWLLKHLFIEE